MAKHEVDPVVQVAADMVRLQCFPGGTKGSANSWNKTVETT